MPWLADEPLAGVHLIHVAESGNGWYRPEDPENEVLCLSRRTKMTLRLPKHRLDDAESLIGKTLDIDGNQLVVGKSTSRKLSTSPIVFARYVIAEDDAEEAFLRAAHAQITELGIRVRKMMCGKRHRHNMPSGPIHTRSLMLADLEVEEAVTIQKKGIGEGRIHGCGLFLPHKGITAVKEAAEKIQSNNF